MITNRRNSVYINLYNLWQIPINSIGAFYKTIKAQIFSTYNFLLTSKCGWDYLMVMRVHTSWHVVRFYCWVKNHMTLNTLSTNPTIWSNTLKQLVGFCRWIVWVNCFTTNKLKKSYKQADQPIRKYVIPLTKRYNPQTLSN